MYDILEVSPIIEQQVKIANVSRDGIGAKTMYTSKSYIITDKTHPRS